LIKRGQDTWLAWIWKPASCTRRTNRSGAELLDKPASCGRIDGNSPPAWSGFLLYQVNEKQSRWVGTMFVHTESSDARVPPTCGRCPSLFRALPEPPDFGLTAVGDWLALSLCGAYTAQKHPLHFLFRINYLSELLCFWPQLGTNLNGNTGNDGRLGRMAA
jgi:hypothetical protein